MKQLLALFLVGVGGGFGSLARYAVARWCTAVLGTGFPWGTLLVNVSGSFLLGMVATLVAQRMVPFPDQIRLAVAIGFLGGYTTFSTFEYESERMLNDGQWLLATLNLVGSVVAGLIAVRLGGILLKRF